MHPDRAPGPDGYNAGFFQHNWDIVSSDVCAAVTNFFSQGKLLRQLNHTFLTLIPKTSNASNLSDYRPISCCNVLYKLITKVLSNNRLLRVIRNLVSFNQNAFIKDRNISDCSLLAHELIRDFEKRLGHKCACFKIDLHKAFDSLNREFIYFLMFCMKFPVLGLPG